MHVSLSLSLSLCVCVCTHIYQNTQTLLSERPDFGERIIVTRTHLCDQYMKKINKEKIASMMRESNLELRREQLMTTVNFEKEAEHPLKEQFEQQKAEENDSGEKSSAS